MNPRRAHLEDRALYKRFYQAQSLHSEFAYMPIGEPRLRWALMHIGPTDDVLDIGCDKGHMAVWFRRVTQGRVVGVDIAEYSIAWDRAHLPDCEWVCSEAEAMPFADDSFDVAVLAEILEHVANPMTVIQEAERVVKPGGKVVITVPGNAEILEQWGSGADDIKRTGFELDGHVREYKPEDELADRPGFKMTGASIQPAEGLPFVWRLSVHDVAA